MTDPEIIIENNQFVWLYDNKKYSYGSKISFLFDSYLGTCYKYGSSDLIYQHYKGMVQKFSNPEICEEGRQLMKMLGINPETIKIDAADYQEMRENLTILSFEVKDVNPELLETLNKFINCSGYIKVWYNKNKKETK